VTTPGLNATRVSPFMPGGAADGTPLPTGPISLTDLTAAPCFGLKGAGSADWLAGKGIPLLAVNRIGAYGGMRVLRLGNEDILLLAEQDEQGLAELVNAWHSDTAAKGYSSWREEGWAWMRLSGPLVSEAMARLCALDLRAERFGAEEIAQTRVARIEAVTFRADTGFDMLFDITASAFFARAVAAVAKECTEMESRT
jgi:sarcosine oxidase subunit gamma